MIPLAEFPAGAHQAHFNRTFGDPEEACNVADTTVVEIPEVYHRLVFQPEQIERLFQHHQVQFFLKQALQAKFFFPDMLGRFRLVDEYNSALIPAREVHTMVMSDGKKPGGEFGAGLKRAHFMDEFKKDIVHNVFGAGSVFSECDAFLINLDGITLVKLLKMTIVP